MELLIDDIRDLKADVIARSYRAGKRMLYLGGWSTLILDNDLGDGEGYDLLREMGVEFLPNRIEVVTSNVVALGRIQAFLTEGGYISVDYANRVFEKPR